MKTLFNCHECGCPVVFATGNDRTREYYPGYHLLIPNDFELPTCTGCSEVFISKEISDRLDPILQKTFLEMQAKHYEQLVRYLKTRHNVTQRDIVKACGITPSYLSHVLTGTRQASITLTRLIEAFVACSPEFLRHIHGKPMGKLPLYDANLNKEAAWVDEESRPVTGIQEALR